MEAPLNHEIKTMPLTPAHNRSLENSSDLRSKFPIYPRDDRHTLNSFKVHHKDRAAINTSNAQDISNWENYEIDDFKYDDIDKDQPQSDEPITNDHERGLSNSKSQSTKEMVGSNSIRQPKGLLDSDSEANKTKNGSYKLMRWGEMNASAMMIVILQAAMMEAIQPKTAALMNHTVPQEKHGRE